jgi:hypothetical protein
MDRVARQRGSFALALLIFLGSVLPGWAFAVAPCAVPAAHGSSIMMPGMQMKDHAGATAIQRSVTGRESLCKNFGASCAACCSLPVALIQQPSSLRFDRFSTPALTHPVSRDGIVVRPALRPPIA